MTAGTPGRSFDETAPTYAARRPGYPEQALEWLLPPGVPRVLDLGAGTGKLTRQLAARGLDVVAVEPSPQMGAELADALPAVTLLLGTAEDIPLPAGDVDAVLVGSAFHWFDQDRGLAEIRRVLRPGGRLGMVGNLSDGRRPWTGSWPGIRSCAGTTNSRCRSWPTAGGRSGSSGCARPPAAVRSTSDRVRGAPRSRRRRAPVAPGRRWRSPRGHRRVRR